MRRPYTDRPLQARYGVPGRSMGMGLNDGCPLLPSLIPYFVVPAGNPGNRRRCWWKRLGWLGSLDLEGRRMRRPYTDRPLSARSGLPGRFMGAVSFVCVTRTAGAHRRKSAVWCSRCPGWSRSTIGVDGGSSGGLDAKGDACVAPTQIGPYPPGLAYWGVPWGSFPFAPAHDRHKSANSAVRCWRCWGRGVGVVTVDNRGRRWFIWRC